MSAACYTYYVGVAAAALRTAFWGSLSLAEA